MNSNSSFNSERQSPPTEGWVRRLVVLFVFMLGFASAKPNESVNLVYDEHPAIGGVGGQMFISNVREALHHASESPAAPERIVESSCVLLELCEACQISRVGLIGVAALGPPDLGTPLSQKPHEVAPAVTGLSGVREPVSEENGDQTGSYYSQKVAEYWVHPWFRGVVALGSILILVFVTPKDVCRGVALRVFWFFESLFYAQR